MSTSAVDPCLYPRAEALKPSRRVRANIGYGGIATVCLPACLTSILLNDAESPTESSERGEANSSSKAPETAPRTPRTRHRRNNASLLTRNIIPTSETNSDIHELTRLERSLGHCDGPQMSNVPQPETMGSGRWLRGVSS